MSVLIFFALIYKSTKPSNSELHMKKDEGKKNIYSASSQSD